MTPGKISEEQMVLVMGGLTVSYPAGTNEVFRVRTIRDRVVIDKVREDVYNKRYGAGGVGGSALVVSQIVP